MCGTGEATRERRCESVARERGRGKRMGGVERGERERRSGGADGEGLKCGCGGVKGRECGAVR